MSQEITKKPQGTNGTIVSKKINEKRKTIFL